ncbi:MAG: hypothetical protein RL368_1432 [Pseudomonadota bacterium]|jgi:hypothetical protein
MINFYRYFLLIVNLLWMFLIYAFTSAIYSGILVLFLWTSCYLGNIQINAHVLPALAIGVGLQLGAITFLYAAYRQISGRPWEWLSWDLKKLRKIERRIAP